MLVQECVHLQVAAWWGCLVLLPGGGLWIGDVPTTQPTDSFQFRSLHGIHTFLSSNI